MTFLVILMVFLCIAYLAIWIAGYTFLNAFGCYYGPPQGGCSQGYPWQIDRADLLIMVILPGVVFAVLLALTYAAIRARRRKALSASEQ